MSASDSEDDAFVSADEYASDDNEILKLGPQAEIQSKEQIEELHDLLEPAILDPLLLETTTIHHCDEDLESEIYQLPDPKSFESKFDTGGGDSKVKSYRKRPERRKKSMDPTSPSVERAVNPIIDLVKKPDLKPIIDIVKVAKQDRIISDLTNHLASNFTKGLASIQETSSSLKGLVLRNTDSQPKDECTFSYNDDRTRFFNEESAELSDICEINAAKSTLESNNHNPQNDPPMLGKEQIDDNEKTSMFEENVPLDEPVSSSITDQILKLSEAFQKLKQSRIEDESKSEREDVIRLKTGLSDIDPKDKKVASTENLDFPGQVKEEESIVEGFILKEDKDKVPPSRIEAKSATDDLISKENTDDFHLSRNETNPATEEITTNDYEIVEETTGNANAVESGWDDWVDESVDESNNVAEELSKVPESTTTKKESTDGWEDWSEEVENIDELLSQKLNNLEPPILTIQETILPSKKDNEKIDNDGWDEWNSGLLEEFTVEGRQKNATKEERKEEVPGQSVSGIGAEMNNESDWNDWGDDESEKPGLPEEAEADDDGWGDWGDQEIPDSPSSLTAGSEKMREEPSGQKNRVQPDLSFQSGLRSQSSDASWGGWDSFGEKKKENEWGIGGWGKSLLSTASAVTQGLTSVIETGLGVPDPATMARIQVEEEKARQETGEESIEERSESSPFPFRNIVSGVNKIVEVAKVQEIGSRMLNGGLDTLESIGKKTMEVLQEGDPGLKKKKALLMGKGQLLSEVLKEARDRAVLEQRQLGLKAAAQRCHFETLFDDFQGLIHLEALEMLSRQCQLRLEQFQQSLSPMQLKELKETLEEVSQLCEIDDDFSSIEIEDFRDSLTEAAQPLHNELSVVKITEVHDRITDWFGSGKAGGAPASELYDHAVSVIAELTSAVTQQFHKSGELLIVKERRKTVEEADCLLTLSSVICSELSSISDKVATILGKTEDPAAELLASNLLVETGNAMAYIKQAFGLLVPVLQLGAT